MDKGLEKEREMEQQEKKERELKKKQLITKTTKHSIILVFLETLRIERKILMEGLT